MMYKKHIAAGLPYVPIYSSLTGLELKPSTIFGLGALISLIFPKSLALPALVALVIYKN